MKVIGPEPSPVDALSQILPDPRSHLAAIVDSSDDPIISKDLTGRIMSWNPAASRLFGYQAEEIVGDSILRLVPPDLHDEEAEILRRLKEGERIEHFETIRLRKDGARIPVSVTISPIRDPSGRVIGASKIARDISDRMRNDEIRFRLAAIVDSADDAIISKNLSGIITSWNAGACRMFGYQAEEMVGQSILRLIPEELQGEESEILRRLKAGERIEHYETLRMRKSGEKFHISATISPIKNEAGKVVGASKIARDISDRKEMERMLIQSEKLAANGRMAATIAHEINNPLESLMNLIYLARQSSTSPKKVQEYLLTAEGELERVSHIARQTLGYYRDTGKPVRVHLHSLLENVLAVYDAKLMAGRISVDARFDDQQDILISKGEMLQIFSNVVANAIDAMPEGGTLHVSTRNLARFGTDGIEVLIRDTGMGISQENLKKIFEPFFTTKGEVGTGIGLWVTKRLVENRGGQISVASNKEGGKTGTTITIFVPSIDPTPQPGPKSE